MSAPIATDELAVVVTGILANLAHNVPQTLTLAAPPEPAVAAEPAPVAEWLSFGPTGLGTAAVRAFRAVAMEPPPPAAVPPEEPDDGTTLFCPGAVRDNHALGELVNDNLVEWAGEVGIYPGQLEKVRSANFGRLMMLTHPATDDPDRLLAAAKCVLAEWATDDHFLDDDSLGADAATIGRRLGVTYASIDPVDLPARYAPHLDQALSLEPVSVAYRSAFEHLGRYATGTQVARLRHELAGMFLAYNHEATWRRLGLIPPVWEYLTHRFENSFLPPMVLVDPVAGYELPATEFADRRVRRVFATAGLASVILNDLYSMARETDTDFDLPKVIQHEDGCSRDDAIARSVQLHNELMHRYVAEATVLSALGSPALSRFLGDVWAWLGGNREWHSTTLRYAEAATA